MLEYICVVTSERGDPDQRFIVASDLFQTYEQACDFGRRARVAEMPYKADWFVYRGYDWK